VVDGLTNPEIDAALDPHRDRIHIAYNGEQFGKAKSLNTLAKGMDADILVFFDNDILLGDDAGFLGRVAAEFEKHDVAEFPKEATANSFIAKITGFEFLSTAIGSYFFAAIANLCPGMNGAAFAIRRSLFEELGGFRYLVNEDIDLAFRAFLRRARFSYSPRLKARNEQSGNAREWLSQRKRWAINNVSWPKGNFPEILRHFFQDRKFRLSAAMLFLPGIV
jgi:cellulose synthase/poly-beta-1,6-N-acetylglucosamine synthase-like glycosyltransferase